MGRIRADLKYAAISFLIGGGAAAPDAVGVIPGLPIGASTLGGAVSVE
jgi:hypothetical protein